MDPHRPARLHYAWVILAVTGLTVVLTAGVTAVPAVLIHPLEVAFGWDRAAIALAVSINVFLYGLAGPFAGDASWTICGVSSVTACVQKLTSAETSATSSPTRDLNQTRSASTSAIAAIGAA